MVSAHNPIRLDHATTLSGGFTLIELVTTLAIAAILVTSVVPSMQSMVNDTRMASRVNTLVSGLAAARAKTIYSGYNVVLCPSLDGKTCWKDMHWQRGWIAFLDRNADGNRDASDEVLRYQQASTGGEILTSKARTRIIFRSLGTRLNPGSSGGSNATFTFCDPRGPEHAVAVVLSNTGRPRTVNPAPSEKAALCPAAPKP